MGRSWINWNEKFRLNIYNFCNRFQMSQYMGKWGHKKPKANRKICVK